MRRSILIVILSATACLAAPITSSFFTCSITGGPPTQSGPDPCGLGSTFGFPPVSASASGDITYSLGSGAQFSVNGSANSFGTEGGSKLGDCCELQGLATASVSWFDTLVTDGQLRPGWILFSIGAYGEKVDGFAHSGVQVGPYFQDAGELFGCFNNCLEPFTLGEAFNVSMMLTSGITEGDIGGADATGSLTFSLFESDGTTPVLVQEAPEPTSVMLTGLGLIALLFGRGRTKPSGARHHNRQCLLRSRLGIVTE